MSAKEKSAWTEYRDEFLVKRGAKNVNDLADDDRKQLKKDEMDYQKALRGMFSGHKHVDDRTRWEKIKDWFGDLRIS